MDIEQIRAAFLAGNYEPREHAGRRMRSRNITPQDIREVILSGEIIEEYPEHFYGPCCLVYGRTAGGRDLHVVLSFPPKGGVITAYVPDEAESTDFRIRRT